MNRTNKKGRPLRSGYTTGACAAAAAKAAITALLKQEMVMKITIDLPGSRKADFTVKSCSFDNTYASCSIIKDAGDDPDITDGAEIQATVTWEKEPAIVITGGEGVGRITKLGLELAVGMDAINPIPRQMIGHSVRQVLKNIACDRGVKVVISVPDGERLAQKTLNSRLGIEGGISIIGTTGIVIPYSISAYKACISQALDIAVASGCRQVVLTTGRRSEKYAQNELGLAVECYIQAGDFIGYSLNECVKRRIDKVTIWGMTGKISKMAAGHLYTNISDSRVDIGFLAEVALACCVPVETVEGLKTAVTANHFRRMLPHEYTGAFCDRLCLMAALRCREKVERAFAVECIMSTFDGIIIGRADIEK
jgi:cobalt-precorrin-5B (C1)-methyltransferase